MTTYAIVNQIKAFVQKNEKFYAFVKKRRIYGKIIRNTLNHIRAVCKCYRSEEKCIQDVLAEARAQVIITSLFIWENTPEGVKYWSDIDTEYRKYLYHNG